MADNDNVIRLDDNLSDNFDIFQDILKKEPEEVKPPSKLEKITKFFSEHKKLTIFLALLLGFLILGFIFLVGHFLKNETEQPKPIEKIAHPEFSIEKGEDIINNAEDLENLIKKANFLYTTGNKREALDLYGKISNYSEALSSYNLGVAQMEEKSYKDSILSFQSTITLGDDRVASAINASVSALYLKEPLTQNYYLQLAQAYLPYSGNLKIYSYLYALTQYYNKNYIEAISPLTNRSSQYYDEESNYMLASLYSYFNNDKKAIEYLSKHSSDSENWFNLALLYARIGGYEEANNLLLQSIGAFGETLQSNMALALIKLKLAEFGAAGSILAKYSDNKEAIKDNPYPIQITLRKDFFDVNVAQKRFWSEFKGLKLNSYEIIFYFAPYKVFDAKEAFNIIAEGGININIENLNEAKEVLLRGNTISRVNRNIANAILETLNGNIRNANKLLQAVSNQYPNHSILHYNLGVNYAQMGDFDKAYQHFIRSFHLNPKDVQTGIFALITAKLTYRDTQRLENELGREISNYEADKNEQEFTQAMLNYARNGIPVPLEFLEDKKSNKAIHYALNLAQAIELNDKSLMIQSATNLKEIMPKDPLTNLLELLAINYEDDPKALSLKLQNYYQDKTINKEPIYYGPAVVREMYVKVAHIIGTLHYVQQDLDYRLITEQNEARGVIQALALTYIYLQEFEKAFTLYNSLIDDFKENDTQTLFLTSVAAIGAGHIENAAALLQLSKLESPTNYETRIANGILYLQDQNLNAAVSQFSRIGDLKTASQYFDFKIDTSQLLQGNKL